MKKNGITFYKTDPIYTNDKFSTKVVGKSGFFTTDEKKTIGLTGKEIDNNFMTLEGRDIYDVFIDKEKKLTILTLNGDKYTCDTTSIGTQSDWSEKDTKSISYIINKPTKLSDFENDKKFTSTSCVSYMSDENIFPVETYKIATITIDDKEYLLSGKVFNYSKIEKKTVEYNKTINMYTFNVTDDMFKGDKISNIIIDPFFSDKKSVNALLTFNPEILINETNNNSIDVEANTLPVELPKYEKNTMYVTFDTKNPLLVTCFTGESGKKYMSIESLTDISKKETKYLDLTINNTTGGDMETYIHVPGLKAPLTDGYVFNGETINFGFLNGDEIILESLVGEKGEKVMCDWIVSIEGGGESKYEKVSSITINMTAKTYVKCYLS